MSKQEQRANLETTPPLSHNMIQLTTHDREATDGKDLAGTRVEVRVPNHSQGGAAMSSSINSLIMYLGVLFLISKFYYAANFMGTERVWKKSTQISQKFFQTLKKKKIEWSLAASRCLTGIIVDTLHMN